MGPTLLARGISQRFGDRVVLDGVDLEVPRRQGRRPARAERRRQDHPHADPVRRAEPDRGAVEWDGRTGHRRRPALVGLHAPGAGPLPGDAGARPADVDRPAARPRQGDRAGAGPDLLERLGLGDRARDKIQDLSGGMAQRVQLAAAMVHEPELLVLDEPFAGLDPVAVDFLSEVIDDHVEAGRNLLFSSHQLDLVEDLCESITLIHRRPRGARGRGPRRSRRPAPSATCGSTSPSSAAWSTGPAWPRWPHRGRRVTAAASRPAPTPARCSTPSGRHADGARLRRRGAEPVGAVPRRRRRPRTCDEGRRR